MFRMELLPPSSCLYYNATSSTDTLQSLRLRQPVPLKRRCQFTRPHGVIIQYITAWIECTVLNQFDENITPM
jgi:hypothetical protein